MVASTAFGRGIGLLMVATDMLLSFSMLLSRVVS